MRLLQSWGADMKKTQHTSGPWKLEDGAIRAKAREGGSVTVAHVRGWDRMWEDEEKANGRLIAAAPDLLAALKYLITHSREHYEGKSIIPNPEYAAWADKARSAIAKATGAS